MDYSEVLSDSDQKVDRYISVGLRWIAYAILLVVLGSYNIKNRVTSLHINLIITSIILIIPTIVVRLEEYLKGKVKYLIMSCCILACLMLVSYDINDNYILVAIPLVFANLYFDKKLGEYTIVGNGIALLVANMINEVGLEKVILGRWDLSIYALHEMVLRGVQYCLLASIILFINTRYVKLFKQAFSNSVELKRNRDGLDVIVDYTDTLLCARTYPEVAMIIIYIIRSLLCSIGSSHKDIEGVICIQESNGVFCGIDEALKPVQITPKNQEVAVRVNEELYILPINERDDSGTVFVNKHKLTMFFYTEHKLTAFVIIHIHLDETESVLNKLVRILYRNIRLALNNIQLTHDMYETQEELVRAFSEISESKSGQTGAHIKRVSEYMKIMASALNLEPEERDSLVIASMMHDIGKLLIPENILEKPGKLTEEEFNIIKGHVHMGYKLLEFSPGRVMEIARVIALQHHEKWDGTGYLGMKGQEIDYYSRIMAVVDVFDALMSKRSYKESWTVDEAYNEIVSQSGHHFDPHVVELFKKHFDEFLEVLNNYPDKQKTA